MSDTALSGAPHGAVEPSSDRRHRAHRTRGVIAWILVVLASLLIPIAVMAGWAIRTVADTNQYVATMAPLARNEIIVNRLADKATDALFSTHIVQDKVTAALPPKAKPIVTPIVNTVHNYVHNVALQVFESPKFGHLWDTLNRHTHQAVVDVLTGKQSALAQKVEQNGGIVLKVTPALNTIADKLNARGITVFNPIKAISKEGGVGITVVSKAQVSKFSGFFNLVVKLRWIIPIVALVLAAIGISVAVKRRKTLLRMAIGVGLVTLLFLAALSLGRVTFLNTASSHHLDTGVAAAVWDTLLRFLKTSLRWTLFATLVAAFAAWVAGPARYAVWIRSKCAQGAHWVATEARQLGSGADRAASGSPRTRRTGDWILEHLAALRIVGVIVAALFLVFGGNLTFWSLLFIVIVLAVYLGLLQLVVAWARRVSTSAAPSPPTPAPPSTSC
jgi:hypothetical protein